MTRKTKHPVKRATRDLPARNLSHAKAAIVRGGKVIKSNGDTSNNLAGTIKA